MTPADPRLEPLLLQSSALHDHLCPRQILGVRMALLAGKVLGLDLPRTDKRLLVFVETDGCFADGVSVASGCWLGRRTMRLMDEGKIAATFVDTRTRQATRLAPQTDLRERVRSGRPAGQKRYEAYLTAYQTWPDEALFSVKPVQLQLDLPGIISVHGKRVVCDECGEEVINEREVVQAGRRLCRTCAGEAYWRSAEEEAPPQNG